MLLPATLLVVTGCTKTVWIGPDELHPEDAERVQGVLTADGQKVDLEPEAASMRGDTLYVDVRGETLRLALDDVAKVRVERSDVLATVVVALGVVALVAAVAYGVLILSVALNADLGPAHAPSPY